MTTAAAMGENSVEVLSKDAAFKAEQKHIQLLIGSNLEGKPLLDAYNAHYDSLSREARRTEKAGLPQSVYEYIADYRNPK